MVRVLSINTQYIVHSSNKHGNNDVLSDSQQSIHDRPTNLYRYARPSHTIRVSKTGLLL